MPQHARVFETHDGREVLGSLAKWVILTTEFWLATCTPAAAHLTFVLGLLSFARVQHVLRTVHALPAVSCRRTPPMYAVRPWGQACRDSTFALSESAPMMLQSIHLIPIWWRVGFHYLFYCITCYPSAICLKWRGAIHAHSNIVHAMPRTGIPVTEQANFKMHFERALATLVCMQRYSQLRSIYLQCWGSLGDV